MSTPIKTVLQKNLKDALDKREYSEAEDILVRLKAEDPLSLPTRGLELELLLGLGKLAEATDLARQLVALHPGSARVLYLAGRVEYRKREYAAAAALLRESLAAHQHWKTRRWLGKTLTQMGRYDEAEALLVSLGREHPVARLDLTWLYERKGDAALAHQSLQRYLKDRPQDDYAKDQLIRLRTRSMPPEEIIEEVQSLESLGEPVPAGIVPAYIQALLRTGQGIGARRFISDHRSLLDPKAALEAAWVCYRLVCYDLSLDLFLAAIAKDPARLGDIKLLCAVEKAARSCDRVSDLEQLYAMHTHHHPALHGRLKNLARRRGQRPISRVR